jgi:hypothetical protein
MPARMPVLRQHNMGKLCCQRVDHGHDFVAARHREAAARAKIMLDVDNQEDVVLADRETFCQRAILSLCVTR